MKKKNVVKLNVIATFLCLFLSLNVKALDGATNIVGGQGQVEIETGGEFCTGTLINSKQILTAGHCVPPSFRGFTSGTFTGKIRYTDDGINWFCITGSTTSSGQCANNVGLGWSTNSTPPYNIVQDVAVVYTDLISPPFGSTPGPENWLSVSSGDFKGVSTRGVEGVGVLGLVNVYGRGGTVNSANDSGVMRVALGSVVSIDSEQFATTARRSGSSRYDVWACDGDSGGGVTSNVAGLGSYIIGINSAIESSGRCVSRNDDVYYYRNRQQTINLINSSQNNIVGSLPSCVEINTVYPWVQSGLYSCYGL